MKRAAEFNKVWIAIFFGILSVKLALYAVDPHVRYFLGDSYLYLHAAVTGVVPPDRTFFYPLFITLCTYFTNSLSTLVIAQVVISACSCLVLAAILNRNFGERPAFAATAGLLCAVEPIQLFYERSVMTETVALLFLALFVLSALSYLARPRFLSLLAAILSGFMMVKLRLAFAVAYSVGLFLLLAYQLALALLKPPRLVDSPAGLPSPGQILAHCVLAPVLVMTLATGTRTLEKRYHELPNHAETGFFVLAAWAPLLLEERIPFGPDLPHLTAGMRCKLGNLGWRNGQRWTRGCLIDRLRHGFPNVKLADHYALKASKYLLEHDPRGVVRVARATYRHYFRIHAMHMAVLRHRALMFPRTRRFRALMWSAYGIKVAPYPDRSWVVGKYFAAGIPWYMVLAAFPLLLVVIPLAPVRKMPALIFIYCIYLAHLLVIATFGTQASVRYLQPLAWLMILFVCAWCGAVAPRVRPESLGAVRGIQYISGLLRKPGDPH